MISARVNHLSQQELSSEKYNETLKYTELNKRFAKPKNVLTTSWQNTKMAEVDCNEACIQSSENILGPKNNFLSIIFINSDSVLIELES